MNWLDSNQRWPVHPSKEWREVLESARNHGWFLTTHSDHIFGRLWCSRTKDGGACSFAIYTSGKGSENAAKQKLKVINKCPHADA